MRGNRFIKSGTPIYLLGNRFIINGTPIYLLGNRFIKKNTQPVEPVMVILMSRYRDNIYVLLINIDGELMPVVKTFVSSLLHYTYGIRLKWEPGSPNEVVWGEGRITSSGSMLSLTRKGVTLNLDDPLQFEWLRWVDGFSPHARVVWRSHFPSLLLKCLWYALNHEDVIKNFKSLMWGVGYKHFPSKWVVPILRRFYDQHRLDRVVSLPILLGWIKEGKVKARDTERQRGSPQTHCEVRR